MSRATAVRALLALVVLVVSGWLIATRSPRLGLDLRGGTQIVLETRDGQFARATSATTDEALEVLRRRVDELGVAEPTLARSGDRRIIVELPGITDPAEAVRVIGRTAQLTFHPVLGVVAAEPSAGPGRSAQPAPSGEPGPGDPEKPGGELVLPAGSGERLRLGAAALSGQQVDGATAAVDQFAGWQVGLDFRGTGGEAWRKLTADAACAAPGEPGRRVAIVLDQQVISSPQVDEDVACDTGIAGGRTQITGTFTETEAKDLALLIRAGGLPVPVEVIEQRTVGPSLGEAAIEASAAAAILGMIATILFIVGVYRFVGGIAAIALVCYGAISYAALLAIGSTLTLPGLAGFVLAIGMALDANVLVFERAREEYAGRGARRSLRTALRGGFTNAWSAIIDSTITTLLSAGLLFFLASGPVRGFGITLSIGVLVSMFTALVLTRALASPLVGSRWLNRRPSWSGLGGIGWVRRRLESGDPDLMGRRRLWLGVSAAAVVLAVAGIGLRGLNLGVEFTGGRLVEYAATAPLSADAARDAVASAGLERAVVNTSGDGNISVRAGAFGEETEAGVRSALAEASGHDIQRLRDEKIGPTLGEELRRNALIALGVALAAQLVYLAVRFRRQWGAATVLAMLHDVLLVVGVFAWLGRPVDGVFLAALLTVIGYSVNDSVVTFDRIRELVRAKDRRGTPFAKLVNTGILHTVPRTVNTGLGAVFILTALAVLGGDSLVDFALALLIGIGVGTYSSVFLAAPLAIVFESRPGGLATRLETADR
ncbi:protein translocase subunit SecDF [Paractinoplanes abujensis]|uniref:Multifunctional fusion protein n=1 Tax=Paractinoplanes abujensis TaxID=882441 RepID=A0A7W7CUQ1_9ACTN|nr:protein translocase subunit SecD [Actinoplanes abujensis]MBB4693336.1 SecD/SecF fusion protein [Actinoplanes abujensis]GID24539.1 protein translocase subunit SecDF [Actinoplanes abujensis]